LSIQRPSSEIPRLIEELSSEDALRRETAIARLAVMGSPAVTKLIALAGDTSARAGGRVAALQTLEAIGDSRAATVAMSLVDGDDEPVVIAALGVLGPVARQRDGRAARALERLTALALSSEVPTDRRLAALNALEGLPERLIAPLYAALTRDPSPQMVARATRKQAGAASAVSIDVWLAQGLPDDPAVATAVVREDAEQARVADLRQLVELIRAREQTSPADQREAWMAVRGLVHQSLAARGSRIGLYDVRETLERAAGPLPVGFLSAAGRVGDTSCLEPLAACWMRARPEDRWWRDHLADAFGAIVGRERITRRHAVMKTILARWPAAGTLVARARKG